MQHLTGADHGNVDFVRHGGIAHKSGGSKELMGVYMDRLKRDEHIGYFR